MVLVPILLDGHRRLAPVDHQLQVALVDGTRLAHVQSVKLDQERTDALPRNRLPRNLGPEHDEHAHDEFELVDALAVAIERGDQRAVELLAQQVRDRRDVLERDAAADQLIA